MMIQEIEELPISSGASAYLWNVKLKIHMNEQLKRVASRNHKIQVSVSNDGKEVDVALDGSEDLLTAPTKDFILLIRDDNIN